MCGIAAEISASNSASKDAVWKMIQLASHRGPDGQKLLEVHSNRDTSTAPSDQPWAVLAHARLAIIDQSEANSQPMSSPCGRYAIVFNGEIYNYVELRRLLESRGRIFRTSGDTEVLLQALIEWGESALNQLRGMFAFIFVDRLLERVLAVRDRYGIKPLFIWHSGRSIYLASEIKQFTSLPFWSARLNTRKAIEFLLYGVTDFDYETLFDGVTHVKPGELVSIERRAGLSVERRKWWTPKRERFDGSFDEAVHTYRELFQESLSIHLRADVPIASCLSGGIDSSAIVGGVARWFGETGVAHQTFTAVSESSRLNESRYATAVNEFAGCIGHQTMPTAQKLWDELARLTWHQDEPFGSTSIFAQWCVFQHMQEHNVRVALDGQGADEQLGGYNSFIHAAAFDLISRMRLISAGRLLKNNIKVGRITTRDIVLATGHRYGPKSLKRLAGSILGLPSQNAGQWLNPDLIDSLDIDDPFAPDGEVPTGVMALSVDMVDRINLPMLLRFEDRNSMAFGVEARVPFVDHELMEFALGLPGEFNIREGTTKTVLRTAAADTLPDLVKLRRDKIGFQMNESEWMSSNKEMILARFDELYVLAGSLFSVNTRKCFEENVSIGADSSTVPWRLTSLLEWMRMFGVRAA